MKKHRACIAGVGCGEKTSNKEWAKIVDCLVGACIEMREIDCAGIGYVELRSSSKPKNVLRFSDSEWKKLKKLIKSGRL